MGVLGTILRDRYEIMTELGKGGMSTVYLARDKTLGSYWAVKQVKNTSDVDMAAFKKEVELLSSLSHSDIPRIVDRIEIGDDYYVVMDFVDGTSLGKKVLTEGVIEESLVVEWAKMLCGVLDYLHHAKANPIIYRDMKPENVMLTQAGRIKLIDFGIAKECPRGAVQTGDSIGTRGYAAPEQYKGASNILDERSDIYSLGATLFFLVTGIVPGKPPKAMRPIRQINVQLSEGLEYIIMKCTQDDPTCRYQSAKELLADLNNISQLTSSYRNKMHRRLWSFVACVAVLLASLSLIYVGYRGMQAKLEDHFQRAFQSAMAYQRMGDYDQAADYYAEAVTYKPDDYDTYVLLFNSLLPKDQDDDYIQQTKAAIDEMSNRYLDNQNSGMYHNSKLMYLVVKKCIEVNDPAYADMAVQYIEQIKQDASYVDKTLAFSDLESYEIIASNCARDFSTQDFTSFNEALTELEEKTDTENLSADSKLENYYTLILMYSTYPTYLEDPYVRISEIGEKAKAIIDANMASEQMTFSNIIPLYEAVASNMYNSAFMTQESADKEAAFLTSLLWFGYLDDLNDDLDESLLLKKGNAYFGIFSLYNTIESQEEIDPATTAYLDDAISVYSEIIQKNDDSFLGYVYLTEATLEKVLLEDGEQDFSVVLAYYDRITEIKTENKNLSSVELVQFSSLKNIMANAGLEVDG